MSQPSAPLVAPTAQAPIAKARWAEGVTIGVIVFFALTFFIGAGIDKALALFDTGFGGHFTTHYARWMKSLAWAISGGRAWPEAVPAYWAWARVQPGSGFAIIYFTAMTSALAAAFAGIWLGMKAAEPKDPHIHVRGRQLRRGQEAKQYAQRVSREKCAISKPEIQIHDSIVLSRAQVLQSMMIMGAQGGGKTQILWRIINPLIQRGWKTVIFDLAKGDFTVSIKGIHRLIALGDARSSVWAIWKDVKTLPDCESFARGLIPESSDPIWSNAARGILIVMMMRLISERGQDWRWSDLRETAFAASVEEIHQWALRYYPPAAASVADPESKTTQSIMINLKTDLAPLYRFAEEWAGASENFSDGRPRPFSWIDWLNDDDSTDRQIVLQSNAKDKTSSTALIRAMMEVQVTHIASLEFSESKTRSIFYVLDELPQLGRLGCLPTIMEVGRSKGCAVALVFQDIAQIRQINKQGEDDKWLAMLGIRIFAKISGYPSQKFVLDQIGTREAERPTTSVTSSASGYSVSTSWQRVDLAVMSADELEMLGPLTTPEEERKAEAARARGEEYQAKPYAFRAIVLGQGRDVLELEWPLYPTPEYRKAKVARPAVILNTQTQVNVIEAKIEAPAIGFEIPKTSIDKSNFEITETHETCASIEFEQVKEILEIPEIFVTFENAETESTSDRQESAEEAVADEVAQHMAGEVIAEAVGIEPEAVEAGLALLDELGGGAAQSEAETVKVMTPAQMRKARQREREAAK